MPNSVNPLRDNMTSSISLKSDVWKAIFDTINTNARAKSLVKRIYSAYPSEYIDTDKPLDSILPMIVIHAPNSTEESLTLNNSLIDNSITIEVETIVGETEEIAKKVKEISDAVQYALRSAEATLYSTYRLMPFIISGNRKDYEFREGNKIEKDVMTLSFSYQGA